MTDPSVPRTIRPLLVTPGKPLSSAELPRVAVVIPSHDGLELLKTCLPRLAASDYPRERVRVIVVDNASRDGTPTELDRLHPEVEVIVNERNLGFCTAINQGAKAGSDAEILVLLNNDVHVEPDWLRELVSPIVRDECECTGARMILPDGKSIDWAGGGGNFQGIAIGYLDHDGPERDLPRKCFFACGGAMAIRAEVFEAVERLDEEFFAYYDDLDLGWRLWLEGYRVHYVPTARCIHHRSTTSGSFPREQVRLLQIRNSLFSCVKHYSEENLKRVLPALLALATRRMWLMSGIADDSPFRIEKLGAPESGWKRMLRKLRRGSGRDTFPVQRLGAADLLAMNDLLGNWEHWMERRKAIQARRKRPDEEIFELFVKPLWCVESDPGYVELQKGLVAHYGLDQLFGA